MDLIVLSHDEIQKRIDGHAMWLINPTTGERLVFQSVNVLGFCFRNRDLRDAIFINSYLRDCDFRHADLRGADFTGANLSRANMNGTDLRYANMTDANMTDAEVENADLRGAILVDTNMIRVGVQNSDFRGANMKVAGAPYAFDGNADLRDTYLSHLATDWCT